MARANRQNPADRIALRLKSSGKDSAALAPDGSDRIDAGADPEI